MVTHSPKTAPTLPLLTDTQKALLERVWRGAGERTHQAAIVLSREFGIQPWQVKAWVTNLGIAEPDLAEFSQFSHEIMGEIPIPPTKIKEPANSMNEKKCAACKSMKPRTEYRRSPRTDDGLTKCCISCIEKQHDREERKKQHETVIVEPEKALEKVGHILTEELPESLPQTFTSPPPPAEPVIVDDRYEMLYMLLRELPADGVWALEERNKWTAAFSGIFEYLVRVERQ